MSNFLKNTILAMLISTSVSSVFCATSIDAPFPKELGKGNPGFQQFVSQFNNWKTNSTEGKASTMAVPGNRLEAQKLLIEYDNLQEIQSRNAALAKELEKIGGIKKD